MSLFGKKPKQVTLKDKFPQLAQALMDAGIEEVEMKNNSLSLSMDQVTALEGVLDQANQDYDALEQQLADEQQVTRQQKADLDKAKQTNAAQKATIDAAEKALEAATEYAEVEASETLADIINAVTEKMKAFGKQPGAKPTSTEKPKEEQPDKHEKPEEELSEADAETRKLYDQMHNTESPAS